MEGGLHASLEKMLLDALVRAGWNMVVAGATASGKTTCLGALAAAFAPDDRVVTIEETAEFRAVEAKLAGTPAVSPIRDALLNHPKRVLLAAYVASAVMAGFVVSGR